MQKINIWKLTSDGNQIQKAVEVNSIAETDTERPLEDVLTTSPELLLHSTKLQPFGRCGKGGLGESILQWPNTTGYTFYLRELTTSGTPTNRAYISLYAPEDRNGKIQVLLHARAIEVVSAQNAEAFAKAVGSAFVQKPNGSGEVWIDSHRLSPESLQLLTAFAQRIAIGWKAKMEGENQAVAEEANLPLG